MGPTLRAEGPEGAYLEAGSLWLYLSLDPQARTLPHPDHTHLAFDVAEAEFQALSARVRSVAPV